MSIKKELIKFKQFRDNYNFEFLQLEEKEDGLYYKDYLVMNDEFNLNESEDFINVGYKLKGSFSKTLSNLYPYEFKFRGKKVSSIESVFQGIKFKDKKAQNLMLKYSGLDSNNIRVATDYDWKVTGNLYWQGKEINRYSKEYDDFLDELYVSAISNPLYKGMLRNVNKYILHSMGKKNKEDTVFTRYEFERMLNTIKAYVKSN
jgi:hypothetical protein